MIMGFLCVKEFETLIKGPINAGTTELKTVLDIFSTLI